MHWFVRVFTDRDDESDWTNCVVIAGSERQAQFLAYKEFERQGYDDVHFVDAEEFNQFEHGDLTDYDIYG